MSSISAPEQLHPSKHGYIRAHTLIYGIHIQPRANNCCQLTIINQTDVKDTLTKSIINTTTPATLIHKMKIMMEFEQSKNLSSTTSIGSTTQPSPTLQSLSKTSELLSQELSFSLTGEYKNNHQLLCKDYSEESQRILSIYLGLISFKNVKLDWQFATAKEGISVKNCDIAGTAFKALKSTCVIKGKKEDILKLLTNVEKSTQYDESMEGVEVR